MHYPVPALWRVQITEVHDGDTITVIADRGVDETAVWHVRLKDVFAPELSQTGGPETRDFVKMWVGLNGDGSPWPFLLETFRTPKSDTEVITFERYVGAIISATGKSLNADIEAYVKLKGYSGGIGA